MSKINYSELSTADLRIKLSEEKQSYAKLKFSHAVTPIENPMVIRAARKNIARINTELSKRND